VAFTAHHYNHGFGTTTNAGKTFPQPLLQPNKIQVTT